MKPRKRLIDLLVVALGFCCLPSVAKAQVADWKQIHFPPLNAFSPQEPHRVELSNGMVIFLQEDHELPLSAARRASTEALAKNRQPRSDLVSIYGRCGAPEARRTTRAMSSTITWRHSPPEWKPAAASIPR